MLKKMFKTIFVLSLCIGVVLPTNAAVSVSDGSAFVTKAEFAADLNNLSNRMAQLENSLDAKIDSLVSSYLTRNGIWNGAKQVTTANSFSFVSDSNSIPYYLYKAATVAGKSFAGSSKHYLSYKVVNSLTKSGMCVANVYFNAWGTYPGAERNIQTSFVYQMGHTELMYWSNVKEDVSAKGNFGTIIFGYENQNYSESKLRIYTFNPLLGSVVSVGFVAKGDPLYINWCLIIGSQGLTISARQGTDNLAYIDDWTMTVNDISVY